MANTGFGLTPAEFYYFAKGVRPPNVLARWTPNYNGVNSRVSVPSWQPTGGFELASQLVIGNASPLIIDLLRGGLVLRLRSERIQLIIDSSTFITLATPDNSVIFDNSYHLRVVVESNRQNIRTYVDDVLVGSTTTGTPIPVSAVNQLGSDSLLGQMREVLLVDSSDPSNSRNYPSIINSETMPNTTVLQDVSGDGYTEGTLINFGSVNPWVEVIE